MSNLPLALALGHHEAGLALAVGDVDAADLFTIVDQFFIVLFILHTSGFFGEGHAHRLGQ